MTDLNKYNKTTIAITVIVIIALSNIAYAFEQGLDLNADGRVNDLDIIIIKKAIETGQCSSTKTCDLNTDGKIDMGDYNLMWDSMYGGFSQAPTATGKIDLGRSAVQQAPIYPSTGSPSGSTPITAGESFKLGKGMTGVLDATDGFKIFLTETEKMTCLKIGQCPPSAAHVELRPRDGIPRVWTMAEGHEENFGNYKIIVLKVDPDSGTAQFVVTRQGATSIKHELEPQSITIGSPFKLSPLQYGYIEGRFKIRLEAIIPAMCAASARPDGTVEAPGCKNAAARISVSLPDGAGEFSYEIGAGSEAAVSDKFNIKLLESPALDAAVFVVEEKSATPETNQRVQVSIGEPFKIETGWTGFKLGTDGFEFNIVAIDLPTCGLPIAVPNSRNPSVIAPATPPTAIQSVSVAPMTLPAPPTTTPMPKPYPCKSGAVAIKINGQTQRLEAGQTAPLTDKYTITILEIRGLASGQRMAVILIKDKASDVIEIPFDAPFELAVGQTSQSDPYFTLKLTGINQVQCIRAPCPARAELRLETNYAGDFEMSVAEGMKEPRAGLIIEAESVDSIKKRAKLVVSWTNKPPLPRKVCSQYPPPAPEWCTDGKVLPGKTDEQGCQGPPMCNREQKPDTPGQQPGGEGTTQPGKCNGCTIEDKCIATGVRLKDPKKDLPVYCDIDGTLSVQKINGEPCQNSHECSSNTCSDGKCASLEERLGGIEKEVKEQRGILDKILGFFKKIFGM